MLVRLGASGLRLRFRPLFRGSSMRSNKLLPGRTAVSNGFLTGAGAASSPDDTSVRRMGCPFALAPSNSRIAWRASCSSL